MSALRRWGPRILGIALFVWAVAAVGPGNVWRGLRAADWGPVIPAALAALPFIYVKAWRWARILDGLDVAVPLGAAFRYYSIGLWAGQVTPGQAGDFVWAVAAVGPGNVWRGLRAADWWLVLPAALAALPFIYVKAWRWARILAGLDVDVPLGAAFRYYSIGLWAGQVTPGQAGDFVKAWYVRSRGAPLERALLSALLDRLFDFAALFAVGAAALFAFADEPRTLALVTAALVAVCAALAAAMTAHWRAPLLALLGRLTPAALRDRLGRSDALRSLAVAQLDARHLAPVLALTAASWVLSLARIYLCFYAVDVRLPLLDFLLVSALTTLASLISIGGVGTRDVALLALLAPFGYDGAQALAVSFLILALTISNMVPGFLIWLREPLPLRRVETLIEGPPGDGED